MSANNGNIAGSAAEKCSDKDSRLGLLDKICRIRSRGRWLVGSARNVSDLRFVLKTGEDHLNGVYSSVNDVSLGKTADGIRISAG